MNVQDFLVSTFDELTKRNGGNIMPWATAYEIYSNLYPDNSTSGYFRTKYNNYSKSGAVIAPPSSDEIPRDLDIIIATAINNQTVEIDEDSADLGIMESLPVHNYTNQSEAELPGVIPTGTLFDRIICNRYRNGFDPDGKELEEINEQRFFQGGFSRKAVDVRAGDPGAGKTTSTCFLVASAIEYSMKELQDYNDRKALLEENLEENEDALAEIGEPPAIIKAKILHGEMSEEEWLVECANLPLLRLVDVSYLDDIMGASNYFDLIKREISQYDLIVIDSFPILLEHLKLIWPKEKEKPMIIRVIRELRDEVKKHNANVQLINQANKDGSYKGGTELPHLTSSLSYVKKEDGQRYLTFEKNRNNGDTIQRKAFISRKNKRLVFDVSGYESTYENISNKQQTLKNLAEKIRERNEKDAALRDTTTIPVVEDTNQTNLVDMISEVEQEQASLENTSDINTPILPLVPAGDYAANDELITDVEFIEQT